MVTGNCKMSKDQTAGVLLLYFQLDFSACSHLLPLTRGPQFMSLRVDPFKVLCVMLLVAASGKPLIYFSLLFCTFLCFFSKKAEKVQKSPVLYFFLTFSRGSKKVDHFSKSTSTQKVHVIKETLTDLKSIL